MRQKYMHLDSCVENSRINRIKLIKFVKSRDELKSRRIMSDVRQRSMKSFFLLGKLEMEMES